MRWITFLSYLVIELLPEAERPPAPLVDRETPSGGGGGARSRARAAESDGDGDGDDMSDDEVEAPIPGAVPRFANLPVRVCDRSVHSRSFTSMPSYAGVVGALGPASVWGRN